MLRIALILSLACTALPIHAQQFKPLAGEYSIGGQTVIDPPPNESHTTHLYVALAGNTARDLYNNMRVTTISDACGEPGALLKSIGNMQCTRDADGKDYQCNFAIDIAKQRITGGGAC